MKNFKAGKKLVSFSDVALSDRIWFKGKVVHKKWFMNWTWRYILRQLEAGEIYEVIPIYPIRCSRCGRVESRHELRELQECDHWKVVHGVVDPTRYYCGQCR